MWTHKQCSALSHTGMVRHPRLTEMRPAGYILLFTAETRNSQAFPSGHMLCKFQEQWPQTPWFKPPGYVKDMLIRDSKLTDFVAKTLRHTFDNPMLIRQATTHTSFSGGGCLTPSFAPLASLGAPLVDLLITSVLEERLAALDAVVW